MAKQISITVPDTMYSRIQDLKGYMGGKKGTRKISKFCQKAIETALEEAEASRLYREEGIKDGEKLATPLSEEDKKYISQVLKKDGPYKKWSEFKKIEKLDTYFTEIKNMDIDSIYPQFMKIMKGQLHLKDSWVEVDDDLTREDRRGEVAWSYTAGCFEGINEEYTKNKGG